MRLAGALSEKERAIPIWLKRLISEHIRRTRFWWQLYPGLLSHRFKRLASLNWFNASPVFPRPSRASSSRSLRVSWPTHR